jgi:sn-glycerol 3-phosphate transport system ATP-binding protein
MAQLSLRSISKSFGSGASAHRVLHDINLEIADGEFVVVIGPSGCGKSTLLRVIAGLEDCDSGEVALDGYVINALEPAKRNLAMVFQNYALYPHMSVFDNMAYSLRIAGFNKNTVRAEVMTTAEKLELVPLLDRKPRELSGGQRQRVAMGRAIVRKPQVFLFDEPLSNLDAKLRAQTRLEIQQLHRQLGTTCLFVTHDQVEAMTLANRIIVLNAGQIEQVASPEEIYMRPSTIFVARFMGSPPMNLISNAAGIEAGIVVGVRPEDWIVVETGWPMRVEAVELLGAERLIYGRMENQRHQNHVVLRIPAFASVPEVNDVLHLAVAPGKSHYFNERTGLRISHY